MQPFPSALRESNPSWMSGGRDIAFVRFGSLDSTTLMRRPWDGSAAASEIASHAASQRPFGTSSWLPSGGRAIVQIGGGRGGRGGRGGPQFTPGPPRGENSGGPAGAQGRGAAPSADLKILTLGATDSFPDFIATPDFDETSPAVSPDGRFVAYTSTSSGRQEVYVSPIPPVWRRLVSRNGGALPKWSRTGREIFYRNPGSDTLFAARVSGETDLTFGEPRVVLAGANLGSGYAPLPGDSLFIARPPAADDRRPIIVVLNFVQELERLFARR
jgi:hypothetical protein